MNSRGQQGALVRVTPNSEQPPKTLFSQTDTSQTYLHALNSNMEDSLKNLPVRFFSYYVSSVAEKVPVFTYHQQRQTLKAPAPLQPLFHLPDFALRRSAARH